MNKAFLFKHKATSPPHQAEVSASRLPQELLDTIVDKLALNARRHDPLSRSTLASCALVSKSMSARARGHLFSTICLKWGGFTYTNRALRTRVRALKRIMEADPLFVSFVRTLELAPSDVLWGKDDAECLPGVLTMLYSTPWSSLCALRIITPYTPLFPRSGWSDIEGVGRKALVNLFLSGCLTELTIRGPMKEWILLLPKILKGLVTMELSHVSFSRAAQWGTALDVGEGEGARLEKLVVDEESARMLFVDLEAGPAANKRMLAMMQGLKTLELRRALWNDRSVFGFAVVLEQCTKSLQRLVWSINTQDEISTILSHVPLSSFTTLRSLTFKMWTYDGLVSNINTCDIFSAIQGSAMPSLEHLVFTIRLRSTQSRQGTIDDLTELATGWGWEALDVALASAVQYPWLGLVEMGIGDRLATEEVYAKEEARGHLEALFPSILARGVNLKISLE